MEPLVILYRFEAQDGTRLVFDVELDPVTLQLPEPDRKEDLPKWTLLEFNQCPHCPFTPDERPHCPAAAHLPRLIETFNHLVSHDRARVRVITSERSYIQDVSMQTAIGSLMGVLMATSGCPYTMFFRPMARFHLPFSTQDETIYRAAAAYLLADYFRTRESGQEPDKDLEGLTHAYEQVHIVNTSMLERLKASGRTDASLNALLRLDMFALMLPFQAKRELPGIMAYFKPFLEWFPSR